MVPGPHILNCVFSVRARNKYTDDFEKSAAYFTVQLARRGAGKSIDSPVVFRVTDLHLSSGNAFSLAFQND